MSLLSSTDVILDVIVIAPQGLRADQTTDSYLNATKNLKPGLTEIIVHLGHDDSELQAVIIDHEDFRAAWHQRDYDIVNSPQFKHALRDNHVILVHWKDLEKLAYPD